MIRRLLHCAVVVLALTPAAAPAATTIDAPASAPIGSQVAITVTGNSSPKDFV